jgi:plastocyanin
MIVLPLMSRGRQLRRHARVVLLSTAALFGASYGSDALAKPKVHAVVIEAMRFSPQVIEVAPGDTVVWTNKDPFPHTVTARDRSFDSGELASTRSWKFKARKKGTFSYVCTLHPTMKGSLVVK